MRVEVYFNLHKRLFSVRHKGKVIDHATKVMIRDAKFVVQPAGRDRVRATGVKGVHAFCRGELIGNVLHHSCSKRIKYNPHKYDSFVDDNEDPIYEAGTAYLFLNTAGVPQILASPPAPDKATGE